MRPMALFTWKVKAWLSAPAPSLGGGGAGSTAGGGVGGAGVGAGVTGSCAGGAAGTFERPRRAARRPF